MQPCREGNAHVFEMLGLIGIDRDGGFATYVMAAQDQLVPVPDTVNDEQAAVIEPISVTVHAVRNSRFQPGNTALVTGGGPIGILLAQVLRATGAREVVLSEVKAFRRAVAKRLGFLTVNPAEENTPEALERSVGQRFVDCVFEASGFPAAYKDAVQSCKVRGEVSFVGIPKSPPEVDILNVVFKEIQASSARVYTPHHFRAAIALLARRAVDVLPLITDQLPLRDAPLGFRKMLATDTSLEIPFAP